MADTGKEEAGRSASIGDLFKTKYLLKYMWCGSEIGVEVENFHKEPRASIRKHFELSDFHMEPRASMRKYFELSDFHTEPRASLRKYFVIFKNRKLDA